MKKKICKPCYAISALFFALPFMVPGVSAASADAVYNVMTGDQTNWPMIIGISVAAVLLQLRLLWRLSLPLYPKRKRTKVTNQNTNAIQHMMEKSNMIKKDNFQLSFFIFYSLGTLTFFLPTITIPIIRYLMNWEVV